MDILTTDISSLSFKCVKEKVDKININELYNSKELIDIINILKSYDIYTNSYIPFTVTISIIFQRLLYKCTIVKKKRCLF